MKKWRVSRVCYLSVAIILLACSSAPSVAQSQIPAWSGTWAASPVRDSSGGSFTQQTLRQIIHTSVGGQIARIHVSNVFGTQPLTIEDVHIALRSNGSSIIAGTDRRIMFSGLATATIQPGSVVISDPIEFPVPPLSDVAISIYFPKPTGRATFHPSGFQTSYIANGDASGNIGLSKVNTTQSSYFLTNLDVQHQAILGSVIALGASITDGYSSAPDANRRWPNDLAQRLINSGITVGVLNQRISGNRLLSEGAGDSAETRFDHDVLEQPGARWGIFSDEPINDLGSTTHLPSGDELIAGFKRLIARAHQKHIQFFCSTLTPYEGAAYWTRAGETAREHINSFVRSGNSGCDAVIDQDIATHYPTHPSRYLPSYDSGDHLHPNDAGLQAIANTVDLALFSRDLLE